MDRVANDATSAVDATWWERWWPHVFDFFLTLWVLRAPVAVLIVGFGILWYLPQAQDLLVELATPNSAEAWIRIAVFLNLLMFVWAMPTHYASRLLINTDERLLKRIQQRNTAFIKGLQKWTPRALGALTFVAMLGAALRSQQNLPDVASVEYSYATMTRHLSLVAAGIAASLIVFWLYTVYRGHLTKRRTTVCAEAIAAMPMAAVRRFVPRLTRARRGDESNLGPLLLLGMFALFALLPIVLPEFFAKLFPRASAVPFVLGGWLPLAAYLAGLGRRLQAPLILFAVLLLAILLFVFGDNYRVRLIDPDQTVINSSGAKYADARNTIGSINLVDAVAMWKRANGCDRGQACPRPIIVAASGGASRAGFFTAGVIGQLLDDTLRTTDRGHGLSSGEVANHIFAFSTVSGSSVGAVMTVAALAASENGQQPCGVKSDVLWHGSTINSWRSCLESMMSGDFLTPVFTGFTFRDMFRFIGSLINGWQDRAALLERSWEERFRSIVRQPMRQTSPSDCVASLECPFMSLRPSKSADDKVRWLPLLVLNGTSVGNGQRIITTMLDATYMPRKGTVCPLQPRSETCPLFSDARLFHNFLIAEKMKLKDVRLSTAAHNSARFPLISPPGEITDGGTRVLDRIVDGGYFENFGAQTATELALAMLAVDSDLRPFILVLSNDPEVPPKDTSYSPEAAPGGAATLPTVSYRSEGSIVTDISGPIKAVVHTRDARGALAVEGAMAALDRLNGKSCNIAWIRVWGEPREAAKSSTQGITGEEAGTRDLSMSWWLSKPVQVYLHEQTDFQQGRPISRYSRNRRTIGYLLAALSTENRPVTQLNNEPPLQCPQSD